MGVDHGKEGKKESLTERESTNPDERNAEEKTNASKIPASRWARRELTRIQDAQEKR